MTNNWTINEEKFLIDNYSIKGSEFCANFLNKNSGAVRAKAIRMNLKSNVFWTEEELHILNTYYPEKGPDYCEKLIKNRTKQQIVNKASRLKLKRDTAWSNEEIEILINNYNKLGNEKCQKLLPKRTYNAISNKAASLNLNPPTQTKTHEQYEIDLFNIESDAYPVEYYINNKTPIKHQCIYEHIWKAAPGDILKGSGCPTCNMKFSSFLPSILYYIKIEFEDKKYYKIGVTNRTIKQRFSKDSNKIITILMEKSYETGEEAKIIEQKILKQFDEFRLKDNGFLKSKGNTELFIYDILGLDKG